MHVADLPNPEPSSETWTTSIEPWQREGLLRVRELLGIDADALLRAGITIVLSVVGAITPDTVAPPASTDGATSNLTASEPQVTKSVPLGDLTHEDEPGGRPI